MCVLFDIKFDSLLVTNFSKVTADFMTFLLSFAELNPAFQNTEVWN